MTVSFPAARFAGVSGRLELEPPLSRAALVDGRQDRGGEQQRGARVPLADGVEEAVPRGGEGAQARCVGVDPGRGGAPSRTVFGGSVSGSTAVARPRKTGRAPDGWAFAMANCPPTNGQLPVHEQSVGLGGLPERQHPVRGALQVERTAHEVGGYGRARGPVGLVVPGSARQGDSWSTVRE
ncbi:hypothetical protein [Streptomyces sp. NPDC127072]|uniref:hypothetical protein n=1 Tax=Streptomyces sp. NPDC127072 TaxID=3347129 RepID=UPI0036DEB9B5